MTLPMHYNGAAPLAQKADASVDTGLGSHPALFCRGYSYGRLVAHRNTFLAAVPLPLVGEFEYMNGLSAVLTWSMLCRVRMTMLCWHAPFQDRV